MTKHELIETLKESQNLSKTEAAKCVEMFFTTIHFFALTFLKYTIPTMRPYLDWGKRLSLAGSPKQIGEQYVRH